MENIDGWNYRLKNRARWTVGAIDQELNVEYHSEITRAMKVKGYRWERNGTYINPKGKHCFGSCYMYENGKIDVCVSPFVVTNKSNCLFEAVLSHEMTHAVHHFTIPIGMFDKTKSEEYALITTASVYDSYGYHTVASWHYPSGYNPTPDFIGPQKCLIGPYEIPRQYLFSPYNYPYMR